MARPYSDVTIGDFSGGLNVRDALTELAPNESPNLWNVTPDERGGMRKRLGYVTWNAAAAANPITYGFESATLGLIFWYSKADGVLYSDPGTGVLTSRHTFTANGRVQMEDFAGACYIQHSADKLYKSTDGTTWTAVVAATGSIPSGDQLATWQNKLWVADSTSTLLTFCAPGDPTKWATADGGGSNYVREGNDYPIVCLFGAAGSDVQANPALIVGKRSGAHGSMHRVIDASTADYVTIDQSVGPGGTGSIASHFGKLYVVSPLGIYETTGQSELRPIGQKIGPLFDPSALDYSQASGFVAARHLDRVLFSVARTGATGNDLCLEYHPLFGAFTARSDAMGFYVSHGTTGDTLLGVGPGSGQVYELNTGGDDNGTAIESWFLTKVFEPDRRYQLRLQHVRLAGRGTFTLSVLPDYATSGPDKELSIVAEGFIWDSDGWDDSTVGWGEATVEGYDNFWPRAVGRAFQLRIDETSNDTGLTPALLDTGALLEIGAWALYGMTLSFSPLGPS